jgi:hypothetical protein
MLAPGFSTAILLHYGFTDAYAIGTGLRMGYVQENGLSITGTFIYNFGTGLTIPSVIDAQFNSWQLTGDIGYNFRLPGLPLVWRPQISAGLGEYSSDVRLLYDPTAEPTPENKNHIVLIPALVGLYPLSDQTFIGGELRYVAALGTGGKNAFAFTVQAGFRL